MAREKRRRAAPKAVERLIYLGPNLGGGALQRYTVFKGGLPQHLPELFAMYPLLTALFAPPEKLAQTERAIAQKGTPQHAAYQQIVRGGKK